MLLLVQHDASEECDDGNLLDGDGCSGLCEVEPGFKCSGGINGENEDSDGDEGLDAAGTVLDTCFSL